MKSNDLQTTIYFVRHAEPDYTNHNDRERPLTPKGKQDAHKLVRFFADIPLQAVFSSPYQRAYDTVSKIAESHGLAVIRVENFRKRAISHQWIDDFQQFSYRQWQDFDYKLEGGESLNEVEKRNLVSLLPVLEQYPGKAVVIGTHGAALCTILHHFDPKFGFSDFEQMVPKLPCIIKFYFQGKAFLSWEEIQWQNKDESVS